MIYSKLHHFKGSQKVHKGSQESVNPLCEPYNKYNILYINKLWATHDQSCEAYVNPLKYATRWYSERLAYFVNPLCEPYNKHKVLYINKLHIINDNLCEAYVNP